MIQAFLPSLCFRPLLRRSAWYRFASNTDGATTTTTIQKQEQPSPSFPTAPPEQQPLLLAEGILAVNKPLDWTSSDVVSYIRGMLERDARQRGLRPGKVGRRSGRKSRRGKNKDNGVVRVGHGGTLDPLATGVLVVAVGKGTKELQSFLSGTKRYEASGIFGFETTTLDMEGNVTKRVEDVPITPEGIEAVLPQFRGTIQQVPPIYSAIRKNGTQLYKEARSGNLVSEEGLEAREVEIINLELMQTDTATQSFDISVECGGGTYIRALIRDIGYALDSVATTSALCRTQQGQFHVDAALSKEDWSPETIYAEINRINAERDAS